MSDTSSSPHRGTFAEGEAHPEIYAGEDRLGSFAEGSAQPETYPGEDHVGTFVEGNARSSSPRQLWPCC
jgi:hypothetical protein